MPDKVFFDSNIIVYAHDVSAPKKKEKSRELIFQNMREDLGVISSQVLSEFFVTVTQKVDKPLSIGRARREVLLLSSMETIEIGSALVVRAIEVKERWQLSYWDGLILAAAERGECAIVYSEDFSDGQSYGSVTVVNPFSDLDAT